MRWIWLLAPAIWLAPFSSLAQTETPVLGGFRFGMTVQEALAVNPGLEQQSVGGDLILLEGGSRASIAGLSFSPSLAFRNGHLNKVAFRAAGLVRNGAQCNNILTRVVSTLETSVGALSGPPALNEYGDPQETRQMPGGSIARFYELPAFGHSVGFANRRSPNWLTTTSRAAPDERAPADALVCEIDVEFRQTAPPILQPLQPPTADQLARAQALERPSWAERGSSDVFEMTLPPLRPTGRTEILVQLDCLVIEGGLLNCAVAEETPPGRWFGEFALRVSRFYRLEDISGSVGRRVRLPIELTLADNLNDSGPSTAAAASPAPDAELNALAAQAPTREELDAATLIEHPQWRQTPDGEAFARYYPRSALERSLSGRAILECLVQGDGSLRCAFAVEEPIGAGFGLAALGIARAFRVVAAQDGVSTAGKKVRLPITFQVG